MFHKAKLYDVAERALRTFIQAFLGALSLTTVTDLNWSTLTSAAIAGVSAVLALLTGMLDPRGKDTGDAPSNPPVS